MLNPNSTDNANDFEPASEESVPSSGHGKKVSNNQPNVATDKIKRLFLSVHFLKGQFKILDAKIDNLEKNNNIKFDALNAKIDNLEKNINIKFDAQNDKFESLKQDFRSFKSLLIGAFITLLVTLLVAFFANFLTISNQINTLSTLNSVQNQPLTPVQNQPLTPVQTQPSTSVQNLPLTPATPKDHSSQDQF
ncbi:MAG: hypothetical protein LBI10_05860 [Deltaproteobacteria bacterium]|jgi:hypothetical protein|nr:hypothetical protein [Deltaproteobacteria bacterium]